MPSSKPLGLLYTGNSLEILKTLPDESVQMCVTSPPYWGLRNYTVCQCRGGVDGNTNGQGASTLKADGRDEESRLHSLEVTKTNPREPDPNCTKCNGTGFMTGLYSVWGGDPNCQHDWISETVKGQSGGPSDKQKSNVGSWHEPSTCSTCSTCSAWYGGLGNEPILGLFIEHLVMIFKEVKRALRDDGTLWVNIGSSYSASKVVDGDKVFALRNDLTPDEIGYVLSELAKSRQSREVTEPDVAVDINS